jgi:hypothetical protein
MTDVCIFVSPHNSVVVVLRRFRRSNAVTGMARKNAFKGDASPASAAYALVVTP